MRHIFFVTMAWSWFVFGVFSVCVELWRPAFVDYLLPIWIPFVVTFVSGILSFNKKML